MGASVSTPAAPTVKAEVVTAAPPQGCPMHKEAQPVKGSAVGVIKLLTIILSLCYIVFKIIVNSMNKL